MSTPSTTPDINGKVTVAVPIERETTVVLEHRLVERLVKGDEVYGAIKGGGGWSAILEAFAARVGKE